MNVFMIRDKISGLYSSAGEYAEWVEQSKGKIWDTASQAQQAISYHERFEEAQYQDKLNRYHLDQKLSIIPTKPKKNLMYKNAEIVEFVLTEIVH